MLKSLLKEIFYTRQLNFKNCRNIFCFTFHYHYNIFYKPNYYNVIVNKEQKNNGRNNITKSKIIDCDYNRGFQLLSITNNHQNSNKSAQESIDSILDHITYERVCAETLDGLNDYFEQLLENITDEDEEYLKQFKNSDISYSVSILLRYNCKA